MACSIEDKKNMGLVQCNEYPSLISGMIETNSNFAIPAATVASGSAAVQAYIQAALLDPIADRAFYWPPFSNVEVISEEAIYQDGPLRYRKVRDGQYRFRFGISENLCIHKAMSTHYRTSGRVFLIDQDGFLIGTELSNGDFAGFSIALLNPEKLKFNTGSEASESPVVVALSNNKEMDKNGMMFDASEFVNELYRIVDVELTIVGTPSSSSIVVDVTTVCDGTGVTGLAVADFLLVDNDDGATHAISTATASTTVAGRYTLAGTAFEDSTLNLDPPDVLSIQAYESTGAVAVNIP